MALIEAVGKLLIQEPLQVRVGVATGLVVVGDIVGSGEAQERGVVGETPNLAARLQELAAPNTLVIAEGTRRLLGDLFELRELGPKHLKGIAGPVRAFAALRVSTVESRFEALRATELSALARPPHGLWELERGGVACCGYAVDFARSGLSQRQNSD